MNAAKELRLPLLTRAVCCALAAAMTAASMAEEPAWEVGGPLAGVKLPPFPTQHGEPPGHPGCVPDLADQGETIVDMEHEYRQWGPQGQAPERELYPGSVEHYRAYMFKYMPIRSFFDRQSHPPAALYADDGQRRPRR